MKIICRLLILVLAFFISACSRQEDALEESQEPLSIELSSIPESASPKEEVILEETEVPLPPQGPYKPSDKEIQTALKNAGYYKAEIDGKIGPLTRNAITKFQAANGLEADGKVGPKTWAVLEDYLEPQALE